MMTIVDQCNKLEKNILVYSYNQKNASSSVEISTSTSTRLFFLNKANENSIKNHSKACMTRKCVC